MSSLAIGTDGCVVAADRSGHVTRSIDNGRTWTPTANALPAVPRLEIGGPIPQRGWSLAVGNNGELYAALASSNFEQRGVFRSTDKGDTWTSINMGVPYWGVESLVIDPDGYLYAGTVTRGVLRSAQTIPTSR